MFETYEQFKTHCLNMFILKDIDGSRHLLGGEGNNPDITARFTTCCYFYTEIALLSIVQMMT